MRTSCRAASRITCAASSGDAKATAAGRGLVSAARPELELLDFEGDLYYLRPWG